MQEFCPPDGHGQIGKAEKRIGDLNEKAKLLILQAGMPYKFMFLAMQFVVGVQNRTKKNGEPSPWEAIGLPVEKRKRNTLPWGSHFAAPETDRWSKSNPGRLIDCAYLGEDWASPDAKWLLALRSGEIISRRSGKSTPGSFPLSISPLEICSHFKKDDYDLTEVLKTIEKEKKNQKRMYHQLQN